PPASSGAYTGTSCPSRARRSARFMPFPKGTQMSRRSSKPTRGLRARVRAVGARIWPVIRRLWPVLRRRRRVTVEVLISDRARSRTLKRDLETALRRVRRIVGASLPSELTVVAQQFVEKDRPLRGCYQLERRPDGATLALIQLAMAVNGRRLNT